MGILFLPARQGRCSSLLFCSAVRPLLLLRLRLRPTLTTATAMALVATLDMATLARGATEDTEDMVLATAVDTPLDTLDSATLVVTTASVRPRLSPRLMPMLRLIPTTDTVTPDLATAVDTTEDSATEVTDTPVLEATTASVRLRPSPRLMLMLRLIPTTDTVTPDLATLA